MTNEFEDLNEETIPEQEFSDVPDQENNMISSGTPGVKYDWKTAPEGLKAPPRIDMNGKEVVIKSADIILPPEDRPWEKTRKGDKEVKFCTFVLHYDFEGQQEFYSGVRVFKKMENGKEKYSHPTITRDRKTQASKLMGLYADYKGKDINEVSLKEFGNFLNSQPKVKIISETVKNPVTEEEIQKNLVEKFISP